MSFLDSLSPQAAAAWIAGSIGVLTTMVNLWFASRTKRGDRQHDVNLKVLEAELDKIQSTLKTRQELAAPVQQRVREHLSKTRALLGRVFISFDRLARLAPTLTEENVLSETTNTLDLYAEYRQHLSGDEYVSYPADLKLKLAEVQTSLARIFLDLQIDEASRIDRHVAAKMSNTLARLQALRDDAIALIESNIRVQLTPLD